MSRPSAAMTVEYLPSLKRQTSRPLTGLYAYRCPCDLAGPRSATYTSGPMTVGEDVVWKGRCRRQRTRPVRAESDTNVPSYEVAYTRPFQTAGDPYAQYGNVYVHAIWPSPAWNAYTLWSVLPT